MELNTECNAVKSIIKYAGNISIKLIIEYI